MDMEPWDPLDHPARIEVRRQESDDSDAEGGLGNVTRIVLRPPGHSGKAKRGHLCFDASYESGNLGRVDFISEYEYDLFIRPDTCNPRYRLWFNFVVDNVRADQRVIFNIVNLCKIKTLFRDGMTPLVKTTSRPRWQRLPGKYVYYHKSPEHRNHYILSFAFAFDREEDVYQFAFSYPYSYARCQAHLDLIEQREFPYFRRDIIGYTLQNRKLEVITIGSPALLSGKRSKVVVILARCHPGESPSSYVAQGILDFMISNHSIATTIRDHVIIKIVPMINPDGIYLGNYRCSLMGYDLNRMWNQISPWAHPTLSALKNYLVELDCSKNMELDMVIDLHAHSSLMGSFIHGNAYDDVYRFERHILFPKLLAHNAEDYNASHTMYNRDPVKSGTARRHLCEILRNTVNVYTLEVSFYGYNQPVTNAIVSYNEDGYFRLGRNIVRTFFEYFRVTGCIPVQVATSAPGGGGGTSQNPDSDKKRIVRRKSRSRSRSRPKSKETGEKACSPTQKTQISNDKNGEAGGLTSQSSLSKEDTPERTVVKLNQLTTENHDTDSSGDDVSSCSDDETAAQKAVKFLGQVDPTTATRQHAATSSRPPRGRFMRRVLSKTNSQQESVPQDSSPSPPTSPTPKSGSSRAKTAGKLRGPHPKAAFTTFDFSILHEKSTDPITSNNKKYSETVRTKRTPPSIARKIGGGGIVGISVKTAREPNNHSNTTPSRLHNNNLQGNNSDTDTDAPCLTIIDFNMLLRKGLDGKARYHDTRGWKGSMSGKAMTSKHSRNASNYNSRKGRRDVRRRRAVLLRGTITDCSPWEDSSSDSDSSLAPMSKKLTGLEYKLRKVSAGLKSSRKSKEYPSSFSS